MVVVAAVGEALMIESSSMGVVDCGCCNNWLGVGKLAGLLCASKSTISNKEAIPGNVTGSERTLFPVISVGWRRGFSLGESFVGLVGFVVVG